MTPLQIVERLEITIGLAGAPRRLRSAMENELTTSFNLLPIVAAEAADKHEPRVKQLLIERQADSERDGTLAILNILGAANDTVAGSCAPLQGDSPPVAAAKLHRLNNDPLLLAIKNLTFSQFEKFGSALLRELGAQSVHVTGHSNDQGIDFFGILNLGALQNFPAPFFRLTHDVELRFAGQAKHYPTGSVGTATVRELIGSLSLARSGTFSSTTDAFKALALKPFNPVLPVLITTGTLTSGATRLSSEAGIVARGGAQLSAFLADKGVGMRIVAGAAPTFDQTEFEAWLDR